MLTSKSKSGLSEASNNKTTPATPRVSKLGRAGSVKSEVDSPSPQQNPRLSIDRSPRSADSKPTVERRSPKIGTPPDKQPRASKGSELQAHLGVVQEDLKKARERLASVEKEKTRIVEELKDAKRLADEAIEKLKEAAVAQKRAEEATEIEKFRADELEQVGIEAAQKREDKWQKELESVRDRHSVDVASLVSTTQELQKVKQELSMTNDAKNAALSHADDAMKIAEINAEKVELLSDEVSRLKSLLDSKLESKTNETAELLKKLESEASVLKLELERAKVAESKLVEMQASVEGLRTEVIDAKKAEAAAGQVVDEWKRKVELLEVQLEEADQSEKSTADSLALVMKQLAEGSALLQDKQVEVAALKENVESLELEVARYKADVDESSRHLDVAQQEANELGRTIEVLKSKLQVMEEEKMEALNNEKVASSNIKSLTEENNKLATELETTRDEGERVKKEMETLASALHEASTEARETRERFLAKQVEVENAQAQIEELKLALKNTQESNERTLEEARYEIVCLRKSVERLETEAKNSRAEWDLKELNLVNSIKTSEGEIIAIKVEMDKVVESLGDREHEILAAKDEGVQLMDKLRQAESEAADANRAAELAKAESLQLRERLLDKENELQNITQENDDLRMREAAALEKVQDLTALLAEVTTKKPEVDGELSKSEKECDQLPKMAESHVENAHDAESQKPRLDVPAGKLEECCRVDEKLKEENGSGRAEEKEPLEEEGKMQECCKTTDDKDLSTERENGAKSDDELDSKMDGVGADQANGLPSEKLDNGATSPTKQQQQLKKKKALLQKFGSLLKKKSNHKQ
ncbi:putative WEB family protein At1g65010, chloroplastic [Phoenix dactylifera]|uniref:WEB family protein At1g65010, chloroplastic n=1 Tax=Phoenix dactylifera TaxID=42345 RepID=A0A8B8ZKV5_PHODC|nr:putative WEB family protein At1g65010, chloroplastic [Phoenix dactylifera]XP_008796254.1 putative WEB family protein At1g65010, chloroplastic [Phoenix dactylifera]XP_038974816.1 putative WEB family protein At1g65010, chloroplastic [Phoenix dactylifera]